MFTKSFHSNGCTRYIPFTTIPILFLALPSNGCFSISTFRALSKYATKVYSRRRENDVWFNEDEFNWKNDMKNIKSDSRMFPKVQDDVRIAGLRDLPVHRTLPDLNQLDAISHTESDVTALSTSDPHSCNLPRDRNSLICQRGWVCISDVPFGSHHICNYHLHFLSIRLKVQVYINICQSSACPRWTWKRRGRAIAHAASRWLPTVEARVQTRI
jgi:hypothetical protein